MAWEQIGGCGDGQLPHEREWLVCQLEMGILYLRFVCGEPPKGCELGIMWHEHDTCDYPSIGVCWSVAGAGPLDAPWEYIAKCQIALESFDEAISWPEIGPEVIQERLTEELGATFTFTRRVWGESPDHDGFHFYRWSLDFRTDGSPLARQGCHS